MSETDDRPTIRIRGDTPSVINEAIAALKELIPRYEAKLFVRGGVLMETIPERMEGRRRIPAFTRRLPSATMLLILSEAAKWERKNRRGEWVPADPPNIPVMSRAAEWAPVEPDTSIQKGKKPSAKRTATTTAPHLRAREAVFIALEATGWKVVRVRGDDAYCTTPAGRTSTLGLHPYPSPSAGIWRWHIDHNGLRKRGRLEIVEPQPPAGRKGHTELTCAEEELPALAEWFPRWLVAYDGGAPLPAPPVPLERPGGLDWVEGYVWTVRASELQGNGKKAIK